MAIVIEHEKRRHEILQKALDVFVEEGYEDVTFQKIADRCGITRTTLYIYFKNKREIFLWSIKQFTEGLEVVLVNIVKDTSLSAEECLRRMLMEIVTDCEASKKLFWVLLSYLLQLQKSGGDPDERVRRRMIRLRRLMNSVIIRGIRNGEFKPINVHKANELLYGLIESAIFRLAVLGRDNIDDARDTLNLAVDGLCR